MKPKFLTREEAAQYLTEELGLRTSPKTLQKWVTTGGGPAYRRYGKRAVYTIDDLEAWVKTKLSALNASAKNHKKSN